MWFCSHQVLKSGEGQVSAVNSHSTTSGFPKFASFQNFQNSGMKFLFRKLTYPLKINIWKKKLPFEMVPFFKACYFRGKYHHFSLDFHREDHVRLKLVFSMTPRQRPFGGIWTLWSLCPAARFGRRSDRWWLGRGGWESAPQTKFTLSTQGSLHYLFEGFPLNSEFVWIGNIMTTGTADHRSFTKDVHEIWALMRFSCSVLLLHCYILSWYWKIES